MIRTPDLLEIVEAIVGADPGPPGFAGRIAIGLVDREVSWLLLDVTPQKIDVRRSGEELIGFGADCAWLVPRTAGPIPRPGTATVVDGDRTLLERFEARYLRSRSHLDIRVQQCTEARTERSRKSRSAR
jgi:hypothetical protein